MAARPINSSFLSNVDLKVGSQLPPGALSYSQVFASPWADSLELEHRHAQLVSQIGFWPIDHTDPEMPVDYAKLFLLCNIFLFNTEKVNSPSLRYIIFSYIKYLTLIDIQAFTIRS